ncbi:MAG: BatA domain-containing protein [candidate division KSB1 bacterium]|nr:BatA domain-containing protein [candidate division KSB1 bacterium]
MISFLNPTVLFGLVAAGIPVLVHLLTRHKAKTIPFSSLVFLRQLEQRKLKRLKLRQLLLLVLRTLIIVFLVLAFARPALRGTSVGLGPGPSSVVMVLDNSASMARERDGRTLFEIGVERAKKVADLIAPGSETWVVLPGSPPRQAVSGPLESSALLSDLLNRQTLSREGTDLGGAIRLGAALAASGAHAAREIYVISDFQASAFQEAGPDTVNVPILALPVQVDDWQNLAVEDVRVESRIVEKGRAVQVRATVRNTGTHAQRNRLLQLFVEGKRVAQASASLEPGDATAVTMNFVPQQAGILRGSLVVEDDGLPLDDERFFVLKVPDHVPVLVLGQGTGVERLLLALNPVRAERPFFQLTVRRSGGLSTELVAGQKVVVLCNAPLFNVEDVAILRRFVEEDGGGLMVVPGVETDVRMLNERLLSPFGLPVLAEMLGMLGQASSSFELGDIDYGHPLFEGVFDQKEHQVRSPEFFAAWRTKGGGGSREVIMRFASGDPFLLDARLGKGRVVMFASGFEPEWSTLSVSSLFAPLVSRAVRFLAQTEAVQETEALVGQPLVVKLSPEHVQARLEWATPEGTRVAVAPQLRGTSYVAEFLQTRQPGFYTLYANDVVLACLAVNMDPRESRFEPLAAEDLRTRYPTMTWVTEGEDVVKSVQQARMGRELWRPLAVLALLCMVVEMALYREKGEVLDEGATEVRS